MSYRIKTQDCILILQCFNSVLYSHEWIIVLWYLLYVDKCVGYYSIGGYLLVTLLLHYNLNSFENFGVRKYSINRSVEEAFINKKLSCNKRSDVQSTFRSSEVRPSK